MRFDLVWVPSNILSIPQISYQNVVHFAEVKFYFVKLVGDELKAFALVSLYSPPNEYFLWLSSNALIVCRYQGEGALVVVDAKQILSVVAMVPFPFTIEVGGDYYFMIEKIGLDVIEVDPFDDDE